ncbi:MAG: molybdopterin-dependent oxidoreductase, partial [Nitrospira sp.]|nr:molybdopterin-dependent oxidoreductase [Nitrospira sp.]
MAIKKTRTVCTTCHGRCGAIVYSEGNKIIKVEGDPDHPASSGMMCSMGMAQAEMHESPDRLLYPMKRVGARGEGKWERISWDEAMDTIAAKSKEIIEKYGPKSIITGQGTGRTSNHWHMRMNGTMGHKGWGLCPTHVCLMPNLAPFALTFGFLATAWQDLSFVGNKSVVMWGFGVQGFRSVTKQCLDSAEQGAKLIIVDPRFIDAAINADMYLQIRPGTDGALALAIMHVLIRDGLYDKDFVDKWCYGFDHLAERVKEWTPERASDITWIPADKIEATAKMMGENRPCLLATSLGSGCMTTNAIQNGRAVACLQALLGGIDDHGGPLINNFWDVMLAPEMSLFKPEDMVEATLLGGEDYPLYKEFAASNVPIAVWRAITSEKPYPVKMLTLTASDPLMCYEDPQLIHEALVSKNLELFVAKDFFISESAKYADIILPTADWSERDTVDEEFRSNTVVSTQKAVDPPGECKDDWYFWREWGRRMNPELWPWKDEKEMVLWRMKTHYDWDFSWDEYLKEPYRETMWPGTYQDKPITERIYRKYEKGLLRSDGEPGFNTPTGRAELYCEALTRYGCDPLPDHVEPVVSVVDENVAKDYPLVLTTGARAYVFFHSAYTNIPAQRNIEPYPFVEIHPQDAKERGICEGDWVTIASPHGKISSKARITKGVGKGIISVP